MAMDGRDLLGGQEAICDRVRSLLDRLTDDSSADAAIEQGLLPLCDLLTGDSQEEAGRAFLERDGQRILLRIVSRVVHTPAPSLQAILVAACGLLSKSRDLAHRMGAPTGALSTDQLAQELQTYASTIVQSEPDMAEAALYAFYYGYLTHDFGFLERTQDMQIALETQNVSQVVYMLQERSADRLVLHDGRLLLWLLRNPGEHMAFVIAATEHLLLGDLNTCNAGIAARAGLMDWAVNASFGSNDSSLSSHVLKIAGALMPFGFTSQCALELLMGFLHGERDKTSTTDELVRLALKERYAPFVLIDAASGNETYIPPSPLAHAITTDSEGYSISLWVNVLEIPTTGRTPLLTLFNTEGDTICRIYIENDTRSLMFRNSTKSSVRFAHRIEPQKGTLDTWQHIVIVHRRSKGSVASKISLYMDGYWFESLRCPYPELKSTESYRASLGFPNTNTSERVNEQAIFMLSQVHLLGIPVESDTVKIINHLGPNYQGTFQDCLGNFMTYWSSAALNAEFEKVPANARSTSAFAKIQAKGVPLIKEEHVCFYFSAYFEDFEIGAASDMFSKKYADAAEVKSPMRYISNGRGRGLSERLWAMGGLTTLLYALKEAKNSEELNMHLELLLDSVQYSWRNSEEMERIGGYDTLAMILRQKSSFLTRDSLTLLATCTGITYERPMSAMVTNLLLYKAVFLNFRIWLSTNNDDLQEAHLNHFNVIYSKSTNARFNARRTAKMHPLKAILFVFKSGRYNDFYMNNFIEPLRMFLKVNQSEEVLRALATFVIFCLYKIDSKSDKNKHLTSLEAADTYESDSNRAVGKLRGAGVRVLLLIADLLEDEEGTLVNKFAVTITWKWTLVLLLNRDPIVVQCGLRIVNSLFITQGSSYIAKFSNPKLQAFSVLRSQAHIWWKLPRVWPLILGMLLRKRPTSKCCADSFSMEQLVNDLTAGDETCERSNELTTGAFPVIMQMVKEGLSHLAEEGRLYDPSEQSAFSFVHSFAEAFDDSSVSLTAREVVDDTESQSKILEGILSFLIVLRQTNSAFADFCDTDEFAELMLESLFPLVCAGGSIPIEQELKAKGAGVSCMAEEDMVLKNRAAPGSRPQMVRAPSRSSIETNAASKKGRERAPSLRREDSFILLETPSDGDADSINSTSSGLNAPIHADMVPKLRLSHHVLQIMVELYLESAVHRVLYSSSPYVRINALVPPSYREHQIYFETFLQRNCLLSLTEKLNEDTSILKDSRILARLTEYCTHIADAIFEGYILSGATFLLNLVGTILEYVSGEQVAELSSIKLSQSILENLQSVFSRVLLYLFSESWEKEHEVKETKEILNRLVFWQKLFATRFNKQDNLFKLVLLHLFSIIKDADRDLKLMAVDALRLFILQRPDDTEKILTKARLSNTERAICSNALWDVLGLQSDEFLARFSENEKALSNLFQIGLRQEWYAFVLRENRNARNKVKARASARIEYLQNRNTRDELVVSVLENDSKAFAKIATEISDVDRIQIVKSFHDELDHDNAVMSKWNEELYASQLSTCLLRDPSTSAWQLDLTEGFCRMRKKLKRVPEQDTDNEDGIKRSENTISGHSPSSNKGITNTKNKDMQLDHLDDNFSRLNTEPEDDDAVQGQKDITGFDEGDLYDLPEEDSRRKISRSLEKGDRLEDGFNISRIVGLQATEGLFMMGNKNLYIIDGYFQVRKGGYVDIFNVYNPSISSLRDPYLRLLSGHENGGSDAQNGNRAVTRYETRRWSYEAITSLSKRRFLFRDVAVEIFFDDGQSELMTFHNTRDRDALFFKLQSKRPAGASDSIESLIFKGDLLSRTSKLGNKLTSLISGTPENPYLQDWQARKISNFEYLMMLNTMAGRTYNDLTQYPVFPWILADYDTSALDLSNPSSFRDLAKPMGAQRNERKKYFEERYSTFAELNDQAQPPFHYGTHYSSAMIVCMYLIRLKPFVDSYLSLQGGKFDHADRIFDSVGESYASAAFHNTSDVRELIPEFFYLSEFMKNINKYDFGVKQNQSVVSDVKLPAWAKGDPYLFIQLNRDALESEYVSQNLHSWIDLIFGYKQRGDEAVGATNVFHHLSYSGSIHLDRIDDPVELAATIGIIHNFGQTPRQIFNRPHPKRKKDFAKNAENATECLGRFESNMHLLIAAARPLKKVDFPIDSINYISAGDKVDVLHSGIVKSPESKTIFRFSSKNPALTVKLGNRQNVIENIHSGTIVLAQLCGKHNFLAASTDGTVSVWRVSAEKLDVPSLRGYLRGHTGRITALASSATFRIIATAGIDGSVILWDLNSLLLSRHIKDDALRHEATISLAISATQGDVLICQGRRVLMLSINGHRLIQQQLDLIEPDEAITCCEFYNGKGKEYLEQSIIVTGHADGSINIFRVDVKVSGSKVERRLEHLRRFKFALEESGGEVSDPITTVRLDGTSRSLYAGTKSGYIMSWSLPDTPSRLHRCDIDKAQTCMHTGERLTRGLVCVACGRVYKMGMVRVYSGNPYLTICPRCAEFLHGKHPVM